MCETQKSLRKMGPLAAVAAIVLLGAPQVRAQAIGFVLNNNPTSPGTTTPDTSYSYNSTGGAISVTRYAAGDYSVTFAGLGNALNSNVVVTAWGPGPNYCISSGWSTPNGADVDATVYCYNNAGGLADHAFTLLYQSRTEIGTPYIAFLWADQPTSSSYAPDLNYSYNPTGGTNTVTRSSVGNYTANLPGLNRSGGTVLVGSFGSAPAHCQVTDWGGGSSGTNVGVNCTDGTGTAADEYFTLVYSIDATAGYGVNSFDGGAIWARNDTTKTPYDVSTRYSKNIDGEEMTAQRIGKGRYQWTMNVEPQWTSSTVLVTAYGAPGSYCSTDEWLSNSEYTSVYVNCFDATGAPSNTRFTATFQLAGN